MAVLTAGGFLISLISAAPADAASNGLWSVFPTNHPGQPAREYLKPSLRPGVASIDSVTVSNFTTAALTFHLYAADAFNTPGGGLSLRRRTDTQSGIGGWTRIATSTLTVPAHESAEVPFVIVPPRNAPPGDHVGGIVAEQTQGSTSPAGGSTPITVLQAVGVRLYGRVVGPLHPHVSIRDASLSVQRSPAAELGGPSTVRVRLTVVNSGNTVLSPLAAVHLTTPFGDAGQRRFHIDQLLPGNSLSYSATIPGVTALGHLHAQVTATGLRASASTGATTWVVPWLLLLLLVLAGCAVLFVNHRRRRSRTRSEPT